MAEAYMPTVQPVKPPVISVLKKLRAIPLLSADTASEVRQLLGKKRR